VAARPSRRGRDGRRGRTGLAVVAQRRRHPRIQEAHMCGRARNQHVGSASWSQGLASLTGLASPTRLTSLTCGRRRVLQHDGWRGIRLGRDSERLGAYVRTDKARRIVCGDGRQRRPRRAARAARAGQGRTGNQTGAGKGNSAVQDMMRAMGYGHGLRAWGHGGMGHGTWTWTTTTTYPTYSESANKRADEKGR
jgi:hypothetical protein